MVAEPWIQKIRKKKNPASSSPTSTPPSTIGILSFELANAMSRAIHLHRSLSAPEISRLLSQALDSPSPPLLLLDASSLLSLAALEKLDDLNRVAAVASRLGRRHCSLPALVGFEHIYSDLLSSRLPASLPLLSRDPDSDLRKMERYVSSTAALYAELEVLSDLEHSAKKYPDTDEARRAFEHKIQWQRHDIKQIRDSSLWNLPFDKAVLLLARAVCAVHARIKAVFGDYISLTGTTSTPTSDDATSNGSSRKIIRRNGVNATTATAASSRLNNNFHGEGLRLHCGANPGRIFLNCISLGNSVSINDNDDRAETETITMPSCTTSCSNGMKVITAKSGFGPKSRLTMLAPPSTVGGSCLALHYANVIIIIEKLLRYPHLVGEEARDDLYQMLPSSLRLALRKSLKSYVKNLAIYDASLAHDWKEAMERILGWLAPMAHNMIRWQTERNFEQHQIVMKEGVLLLQTLYFADREKTEAAICELLVGLNYICRYEQQQNALLDCTSSVDFDDCMDWQQMQYDSAEGF